MADPTQDLPSGLLEAGATVLVATAAAIGGAMKWFSSTRRRMETDMAALKDKHDAIDRRVLELEFHNKKTAESLERIDEVLQGLNKKQDRQMALLVDIAHNRAPKRGEHA